LLAFRQTVDVQFVQEPPLLPQALFAVPARQVFVVTLSQQPPLQAE
jgi:hypothetical protein